MSGKKMKLADFSNFSEDAEWCDEKKDVIVVDEGDDDNAPLMRHQSTRPRRSTSKYVSYKDALDDYGMSNEYSIHSERGIKQYTGKRGQYQNADTIADLPNLTSRNKKKSSSYSEEDSNKNFIKKIDEILDMWTKSCPMDFQTLSSFRNDAIQSHRNLNKYSTLDDKIIISCAYFGTLKYDYVRDYHQNYVSISKTKECIKFCVNRDPVIYESFEDVTDKDSVSNFEENIDFYDIEEVAIGPTKGYSDLISGETIYFAALTLFHPLDLRYNGNYHFPLSVIACGNHLQFDAGYTEALFENCIDKFSKAIQEWPCRYILLLFHNEKELELFNVSMCSVIPDRIKPIYKAHRRQISIFLATHHSCHKKLFDQYELQRKNYETAKRTQSKRDRRRLSKQIILDDTTQIYPMDPEDKVIYFSYPFNEDAKDVITIYKGDLKCLLSSNYLNDALIDFKIKLLINESPAELRSMIHSFHCSFGKNLLDAISGREYQAVSNWTNKIELFKLKYIIVPMNKGMHWSVAIIVNPLNILSSPEEVLNPNDLKDTNEDVVNASNNHWHMDVHDDKREHSDREVSYNADSFIMFMDSLNMHNYCDIGCKLNNYLLEEWKDKKHVGTLQPLRLVKCCVPRQQNGFDCGIFVIKYVSHFLQKCYEYESNAANHQVNEIYHENFAANSFNQEQATEEREGMLELCHAMAKQWNEWKVANPKDTKYSDDEDYIEHIK